MLKEDINVLKMLADQYSADDIARELSDIFLNKANDASDMFLKEKAIEYANASEHLYSAYVLIKK